MFQIQFTFALFLSEAKKSSSGCYFSPYTCNDIAIHKLSTSVARSDIETSIIG